MRGIVFDVGELIKSHDFFKNFVVSLGFFTLMIKSIYFSAFDTKLPISSSVSD
jgi:hypothetical protein